MQIRFKICIVLSLKLVSISWTRRTASSETLGSESGQKPIGSAYRRSRFGSRALPLRIGGVGGGVVAGLDGIVDGGVPKLDSGCR